MPVSTIGNKKVKVSIKNVSQSYLNALCAGSCAAGSGSDNFAICDRYTCLFAKSPLRLASTGRRQCLLISVHACYQQGPAVCRNRWAPGTQLARGGAGWPCRPTMYSGSGLRLEATPRPWRRRPSTGDDRGPGLTRTQGRGHQPRYFPAGPPCS